MGIGEEALAQFEVRNAIAEICIGIDRLDFELIRSRVHEDAEFDLGPFFQGDGKEFVEWEEGPTGPTSIDRTLHNIGSQAVELDGDVAYADTYCVGYHFGPADHEWCKGLVVIGFRWRDKLDARDGSWKVAARHIAFEWGRNETTGEEFPLPPESYGTRDRTDVHYKR